MNNIFRCKLVLFGHCSDHNIDAMHNLFLGVGKTVWHNWIEENLIDESDIAEMAARLRRIEPPSDVPSLAEKVAGKMVSAACCQRPAVYAKLIVSNENRKVRDREALLM